MKNSAMEATANILFHAIHQGLPIREGVAVRGIENVCPELVFSTGKTAMYFTSAVGYPDSLSVFNTPDGRSGKIVMGMFIFDTEMRLLVNHGPVALESALEAADVDPFEIGRPSVI